MSEFNQESFRLDGKVALITGVLKVSENTIQLP